MNEYEIYCAGKFIKTSQILPVTSKYSGKVMARTFLAGEKELNEALSAAQKIKAEAARLSSFRKFDALRTISEKINSQKAELAKLLCEESGKPFVYALAEVERAATTFLIAAEESKRLPKEFISLDWTESSAKKQGIINYVPIGIVAGIAPFNFPLNLAVHKIAPAIAAGCPIILKPASTTPLSMLALAKIIDTVDLPKGMISILPMDRTIGNLLVTDARINLLSFTGSPEVGWKMKEQSGKKKVVLELGGNAGVIISENANVETILSKCLQGAFAYSGQICIHAQRFFVHESIFDNFLEEMRKGAMGLQNADPLDIKTKFSVLIDEQNAIRVEEWCNEAVASGAKLICGGKRNASYFEATIFTNTTSDMKINSEEVFGPVICIEKFKNMEEAIEKINEGRYGLQCGVFTDSVRELDLCFEKLEVGGVIHNDVPTLRFDHMPYGGVKDSGLGREGVKYAIADMLEARILVK